MNFHSPTVEEVYKTLKNNNELIENLTSNGYLTTKEQLYEDYDRFTVEKMEAQIYVNNKSTLYSVAELLNKYSDTIKDTSIELLINNKYLFTELASCFNYTILDTYTYKLLYYVYKYCYTSSFFQNNASKFFPEYDYSQIQDGSIKQAFTDALLKEFDKLDYTIAYCTKFQNFDEIPIDYISYLTQLLGFDKKDIYTDNEAQYRELCKCMIDIFRIKGTNYSFELFFQFLGFNITISEYYFDRRFYYNSLGGNTETGVYTNTKKEYYLTTTNPIKNNNATFTVAEVVKPSDITKQYSINEFEDLVAKYGVKAVLGYSKFDTSNNIYTGKVFKYFKTNYVYYNITLDENKSLTTSQLTAINKYITFLTPAFIMKNLVVSNSKSDNIIFDGDGETDSNGNAVHAPTEFQMLDSEDWNRDFAENYVDSTGYYFSSTDAGDDTTKISKNGHLYYNSLGEQYFRQPISFSDFYFNTNKYIGENDGCYKVLARRLYAYETPDATVKYHWSVPPYGSLWPSLKNTTYTKNGTIDFNGTDDSVKDRIKAAGFVKTIDYYISSTSNLSTFLASDDFNKLTYSPTTNNIFYKIDTASSSETKTYTSFTNQNLYNIYKDYKDRGYYIANVTEGDTVDDYVFTPDTAITTFTPANSNAKELLKKLYYGCYVMTYDPNDSSNPTGAGKVYLYKYMFPLKSSTEYSDGAHFEWKLCKSDMTQNSTSTISGRKIFSTYADALTDLQGRTISEVTSSEIYYVSSTNLYYNPVRVSVSDNWSRYNYSGMLKSSRVTNNTTHMFKTLTEAETYFNTTAYKKATGTYVTGTTYYTDRTGATTVDTSGFIEGTTDVSSYYIKYYTHASEIFNGARFYCSGYTDDGLSNDNLKNCLYEYHYVNRKPGVTIFDSNTNKLYRLNSLLDSSIENIDYCGRMKIETVNGKEVANLYEYDEDWYGYNETGDKDDFIFYNNYHTINWMNYDNESITRPNKEYCDYLYDTITYDDSVNFGKYYSLTQKLIKEITDLTAQTVSISEMYGFDGDVGNGLLSIVEDKTEFVNSSKINYYSNFTDFMIDYYNYRILGKTYPDIFRKDKDGNTLTDDQISSRFDNAFYNMKIIKSFINEKIYKYNIYNISKSIQDGKIEINKSANLSIGYSSTLFDYSTDGLTGSDVINAEYNKTILNYVRLALTSISKNSNMKVKFSDTIDPIYYTDDLTKIDGDLSHYNIEYDDDISQYILTYQLVYVDGYYFKDSYGDYLDVYSEFANLYDVMMSDIDLTKSTLTDSGFEFYYTSTGSLSYTCSSTRKTSIDTFLKQYYYVNLLKKYREKFIEDDGQFATVKNEDINYALPKCFEELDGRGGTLGSNATLQTFSKNNGKNLTITKVPFVDYEMTVNSTNTVLTFYVKKSDFVENTGFTFSKALSLAMSYDSTAMSDPSVLKSAIETAYSKIITVIKPKYTYDITNTTSINDFSIYMRKNIESDHNNITVGNLPASSISVNSKAEFTALTTGDTHFNNTKDYTKYYSFTMIDYTLNSSNTNNISNRSLGTTETEKINTLNKISKYNGYIELHNVQANLIDNVVSSPVSKDWVKKDSESFPDEFISFGDDRKVDIKVKNEYFNSSNTFNTYNTVLTTAKKDSSNSSGLNAVLSLKDNTGKIVSYDAQSRKAAIQQFSDYSSDTKVVLKEEQLYKVGSEYKKDYNVKVYEKDNGDIVIETDDINLGNIDTVNLLYEIYKRTFRNNNYKVIFKTNNKDCLYGLLFNKTIYNNYFVNANNLIGKLFFKAILNSYSFDSNGLFIGKPLQDSITNNYNFVNINPMVRKNFDSSMSTIIFNHTVFQELLTEMKVSVLINFKRSFNRYSNNTYWAMIKNGTTFNYFN